VPSAISSCFVTISACSMHMVAQVYSAEEHMYKTKTQALLTHCFATLWYFTAENREACSAAVQIAKLVMVVISRPTSGAGRSITLIQSKLRCFTHYRSSADRDVTSLQVPVLSAGVSTDHRCHRRLYWQHWALGRIDMGGPTAVTEQRTVAYPDDQWSIL